MTNRTMSCEQFADMLVDFLEHDVDENTRARVEAHALACADCGSLLADLRALRIDSTNLPELTPSRDLWSGIAARIETPVVELNGVGVREGQNRGWARSRVWMGLAAAGLVALTATVTHELTRRSIALPVQSTVAANPVLGGDTAAKAPLKSTTQAPAAAASQPAAATAATTRPPATRFVSSAPPTAEQTYDSEIARLRTVVNRRRGQLDSGTVATIEKNLIVIDDAIKQCKQALRKDPASRFLMESLNDAMDNKVQLLRTAASLPSRT